MCVGYHMNAFIKLPDFYFLGSTSCEVFIINTHNTIDLRVVGIQYCIVFLVTIDVLTFLNLFFRLCTETRPELRRLLITRRWLWIDGFFIYVIDNNVLIKAARDQPIVKFK